MWTWTLGRQGVNDIGRDVELEQNPLAWVFQPVPDLDFDFAGRRYYQPGAMPPPGQPPALTVTRASVAYEDDLAGNWTQFAANTARITNKGLLVEEARTNGIRNNSMQGAVVGTPGTLPTNWVFADRGGLSHSVIGTGIDQGIDYIDIRIFGTTNAVITNNRFLLFDADTAIAAANGQTWTGSAFIKLVAGSQANFTALFLEILENDNTGTAISGALSTVNVTPTSAWTRYSATRTNNQATCAFEQWEFIESFPSGVAIDITLRIGWPQLEQGSFATSPIRTTAAAGTRAADVITVTSPPAFGSAYSLFAVGTPNAPTTYPNQAALTVYDGGGNFSHIGRSLAGGGGQSHVVMSGGLNVIGAVWNPTSAGKIAAAFAPNDQAGFFNSAFIGNGAAGTPPSPITIYIGNASGGQLWNGYITRIAVWATRRLDNGKLQQLTT